MNDNTISYEDLQGVGLAVNTQNDINESILNLLSDENFFRLTNTVDALRKVLESKGISEQDPFVCNTLDKLSLINKGRVFEVIENFDTAEELYQMALDQGTTNEKQFALRKLGDVSYSKKKYCSGTGAGKAEDYYLAAINMTENKHKYLSMLSLMCVYVDAHNQFNETWKQKLDKAYHNLLKSKNIAIEDLEEYKDNARLIYALGLYREAYYRNSSRMHYKNPSRSEPLEIRNGIEAYNERVSNTNKSIKAFCDAKLKEMQRICNKVKGQSFGKEKEMILNLIKNGLDGIFTYKIYLNEHDR